MATIRLNAINLISALSETRTAIYVTNIGTPIIAAVKFDKLNSFLSNCHLEGIHVLKDIDSTKTQVEDELKKEIEARNAALANAKKAQGNEVQSNKVQ